MKKILIILLAVLISFTLIGCDERTEIVSEPILDNPTDNPTDSSIDTFYDKLVEYRGKITDLILEESPQLSVGNILYLSSISPTFLDYNTEIKEYTKEHFMDIYQDQQGYQNDIDRTEFLYIYGDLLDQIINELEENEITELDVTIEVEIDGYSNLSVFCGYSSDEGIIVKLQYSDEEFVIQTAFKVGYEDDLFYVKEMNYYRYEDDITYYYSEYYENDSFMHYMYDGESDFIYGYYSVVTDESYSLLMSSEGIEDAEEESINGGYNLRWYDNENQVRYTIGMSGDTLLNEYYEVFNDHGIVFTYIDGNTTDDTIRYAWNMLEADGWDYAYVEDLDSSNTQPGDGIFKNGINIFAGDKFNVGLTDDYANVRIEKEFNKTTVTEEELNLTAYGLTFSIENLDFNYIDTLRYTASVSAKEYQNFNGINFFGDTIAEDILEVMDPDLLFDLEYIE